MANGRFSIPNGYVTTTLGVLLTAAIGFNAWAVAAVYERPTETKVQRMILTHSPYVADRNLILESLKRIEKSLDELRLQRTE